MAEKLDWASESESTTSWFDDGKLLGSTLDEERVLDKKKDARQEVDEKRDERGGLNKELNRDPVVKGSKAVVKKSERLMKKREQRMENTAEEDKNKNEYFKCQLCHEDKCEDLIQCDICEIFKCLKCSMIIDYEEMYEVQKSTEKERVLWICPTCPSKKEIGMNLKGTIEKYDERIIE